jgi:hypothetical protein
VDLSLALVSNPNSGHAEIFDGMVDGMMHFLIVIT